MLGCATAVSIAFYNGDKEAQENPPQPEPETDNAPVSKSLKQGPGTESTPTKEPVKLIPEYTPPIAPAQENLPPVAALPPLPALPPPKESNQGDVPESPALLRPTLDFPAESTVSTEPPVERAELLEPESLEPETSSQTVVETVPEATPEPLEESESFAEVEPVETEPEPISEPRTEVVTEAEKAEKEPQVAAPEAAVDSADEISDEEIPPEDAPPDAAPVTRATEVFLQLAERAPDQSALIGFLSRQRKGPSPDERRRGVERLNCSVICTCVSSAKRWEVTVVNLGVGGLEMQHPENIPLKTRLAVVPHHYNQTVTGRVVWSRPSGEGAHLGFAFDLDREALSQSWVASLLLEQGAEFLLRRAPRKYVRVPTEIPSLLVQEDGTTIAITLRDVSLGGCLVHSEAEFGVKELTLMLGTVACRGIIVKHRQNRRGWSYHIRFQPLGFLEKTRLRRTITLLLKANS